MGRRPSGEEQTLSPDPFPVIGRGDNPERSHP